MPGIHLVYTVYVYIYLYFSKFVYIVYVCPAINLGNDIPRSDGFELTEIAVTSLKSEILYLALPLSQIRLLD